MNFRPWELLPVTGLSICPKQPNCSLQTAGQQMFDWFQVSDCATQINCAQILLSEDPHVLAHVRIRHTQICGALNSALFDFGLWHVVWEWQLGLQYREACKGNMFNLVLRTIWWSETWIHNRLMPMACEECHCDWANLCIDNHYFHNLIFIDKFASQVECNVITPFRSLHHSLWGWISLNQGLQQFFPTNETEHRYVFEYASEFGTYLC
jgi:hypothetical protein